MANEQEQDRVNELPAIRRILVAVDASEASLAALKTAVSLAAELDAELVGLFVEDVNLLRLADLPFSQEVRLVSATPLRLSSQRMSAQIRQQAASARRALQRLVADTDVTTSFRIVRGQVPGMVVSASEDVDLVILGRISRPVTRRRRLGSTARAALREVARSVMVTTEKAKAEPVVMVTFDDSDVSWRALAQALTLLPVDSEIVLLLVSADAEEVKRWRQKMMLWLQQRQRRALFHQLQKTDLAHLETAVDATGCTLLVWGSERLGHALESPATLLEQLDCSVLLVH